MFTLIGTFVSTKERNTISLSIPPEKSISIGNPSLCSQIIDAAFTHSSLKFKLVL